MVDGKFQVTGQVSVMTINERLLQMLMEKNPDASWAMEESFPFKSMFGNATSLGPIMELGVRDEQNALTRERAAQAVDYWRVTAEQLLSDPNTPEGSDPAGPTRSWLQARAVCCSSVATLRKRNRLSVRPTKWHLRVRKRCFGTSIC